MENNRRSTVFLPIAFALVLIVGILVGFYMMRSSFIQNHLLLRGMKANNTISELIRFIDNN